MQLTSFIIQKTLWKPNNHSLSFVLMRVIEWLMWMARSVETSVSGEHNGWSLPSVAAAAGKRVSQGGTPTTVCSGIGPQSTPSSWSVCVPTSAVLPIHHLSSLNCPNLFKLSLMTDFRYTGPSLTGSRLQYHTRNCQYKRRPTHGLAHWIGLLLYSHINLSSIRQVGGGSGRCSHEEWR